MKKKDPKKPWRNIFPAIPIPLNKDYSINERELRDYVRWLAKIDGIDGIVCNGHTGEITSLNRVEKRRVTEIVAEEVGDKALVISGIAGDEGTLDAIDRAKEMQEVGADGILLMPPPYLAPVWDEAGIPRQVFPGCGESHRHGNHHSSVSL